MVRRNFSAQRAALAGLAAAALALVVLLHVQGQVAPSAPFEFDIVSVKPSAPNESGGIVRPDPGYQTYIATNVPLLVVMTVAYHVTPRQISGGPSWIGSERWDITAKAERPGTIDELHLGLQHVLEDRFHLKLRHEARQESVYDLVVDKGGSKLAVHTPPNDTNSPPIGGGMSNGMLTFSGQNVAMNYFAFFLQGLLGRGVIDQTGLSDHYDIKVQFPFEPGGRRGPEEGVPAPPDFSPLFTALREQLGLQLQSGKGPVDHIVIDSAEKPTAN